jgi:hypothetical protein
MRVRLYLTGYNETKEFCRTLNMNDFTGKAKLINGRGDQVDARSLLGCILAHMEWGDDIWFESDEDLYTLIEPWINVENGDGNYIHN